MNTKRYYEVSLEDLCSNVQYTEYLINLGNARRLEYIIITHIISHGPSHARHSFSFYLNTLITLDWIILHECHKNL